MKPEALSLGYLIKDRIHIVISTDIDKFLTNSSIHSWKKKTLKKLGIGDKCPNTVKSYILPTYS